MNTAKGIAALATSLRTRVLVLVLLAFVVLAVPAYASFVWIVNSTVEKLGTLFAEKQILYDRYRGLGALMQEVKLAETLSRSNAVVEWARAEGNLERRARGLAELEHYRKAFADHSYFFAIASSGNYYFNDADNRYAGRQYSHTLSRDNPRDGWFYKTLALSEGCHLNVDHDDALAVTKVWFNCVVTDGETALGVLGSGLDLTAFIREVVDVPQRGVQAMFVDRLGALQAHRDPTLIDYHSITKEMGNKRTIFSLLDRPADRDRLAQMMAEVTTADVEVRSQVMRVNGRDALVGVGYLDQLGWYNVTFMEVDAIIDRSLFVPIGLLLAAIMLATTLVVGLLFKRGVLDRLKRVEQRIGAVKDGDLESAPVDEAGDEIGQLSRHLAEMTASVGDHTRMLELMVEERTEELRKLAYRDQLTNILNRRGFEVAFAAARETAEARGERLALMLIDIDHFKAVNDSYGHLAGDEVVAEVARRLSGRMRSVDVCGRWGGDEFIVLINGLGLGTLRSIAEAVRVAVAGTPVRIPDGREVTITLSVGASLLEAGDSMDAAIDMTDAALYAAKAHGRDRITVHDPLRLDVDERRAV